MLTAAVVLPRVFGPTRSADEAVRAHLDAVLRGESPPPGCRNPPAVPEDLSGLSGYRILRTTSSNDANQGAVVFEARRGGRTLTLEATVVREGGTWRWCGLNPTGPGF